MRRSLALDNLSRTIPSIDSDQRVALLHTPFKGTTYLFRGELAIQLQKRARYLTVFPSKSGDGQATMTVTVPQEPKKRQ